MYISKTRGPDKILDVLKQHPNINAESIAITDLEPFLLAYAKYSNTLKNTNITLKYKFMTEDSMQSQYAADFLFIKDNSRKYFIYITNNTDTNAGQVFDDMTIDKKTGWFGHELSHITQYEQKSKLRLLGFTAAYGFNLIISYLPRLDSVISTVPLLRRLGSGYLKNIEQEVDAETIRRGLGYELARGSDYTLNHSNIPEHIRVRYSKIYTPVHKNMDMTIKQYFDRLNRPRIHSK